MIGHPPVPPAIRAPAPNSSPTADMFGAPSISSASVGLTLLPPGSALEVGTALSPATPRAGKTTTLTVTLTGGGKPVRRAKITASCSMMGNSGVVGLTGITLKAIGDGKYAATISFPDAGSWQIALHVKPFAGPVSDRVIEARVSK
jgi:hypothetical protein